MTERILEIRDNPPENLKRTPGPQTILYYLHRDESLKKQGHYLPRSTRTIWRILDSHQCILRASKTEHEQLERPEPGQEWGIDFKEVSNALPQPGYHLPQQASTRGISSLSCSSQPARTCQSRQVAIQFPRTML